MNMWMWKNLIKFKLHKYFFCLLGKHIRQVGYEGTKADNWCFYCTREIK